jgi:hypothetical protein
MWKQFMREAHAYLQLPPREFEKPDDISTSACGGRTEIFKLDEVPSKPGACRAPAPRGAPGVSATPKAPQPSFPSRYSPTPTPSPKPTPSPTATPEATGEPTETPVIFYYTAKPGDTLESIAIKFGTTVEAILTQNPYIVPTDELEPGAVIAIPVGSAGQ